MPSLSAICPPAWAAALLAGAMVLLAGCGDCAADSDRVLSDTREPLAAGTRPFSHTGTGSLGFDGAIVRLKELDRGKSARYCGNRFAAEPGLSDAAMVADLSRQLGAGWGAVQEVPATQTSVKIYRWQSDCSKRFYAVMAHGAPMHGADGQALRPLVTMYPCGGA